MKAEEFKAIFSHIKKDFMQGEYAPYDVLYQQLHKGVQKGLIFCEGEHDAAYSICAGGHANGYVLISLLAVFEEYRGRGLGTAFLNELCKVYSDKHGIIVEVEKPENSLTEVERIIRVKRIAFYRKAGFCLIPNINYSIWGVSMHLMALSHSDSIQSTNERIGSIMYDIYLDLMGKRYIHEMQFK